MYGPYKDTFGDRVGNVRKDAENIHVQHLSDRLFSSILFDSREMVALVEI